MTATYTADYTIHGHNAGWPSSNLRGPVSYYHEGLATYTSNPLVSQISPYTANFSNDQRSYLHQRQNNSHQYLQQPATPEPIRPLAIRRHSPGSTDPPIQKAPIPVIFLTPVPQTVLPLGPTDPFVQSIVQSSPTESTPQPIIHPTPTEPIREQSPPTIVPIDPNDRPIRPMKDTSVYNNPPSSTDPNQTKKPLSPLKRVPSTTGRESGTFQIPPRPTHASPQSQSDRIQSASKAVPSPVQNHTDRLKSGSKPVESSSRHQSSRQQSVTQRRTSTHSQKPDLLPLPPSNSRMRNVSARRPIRLDVKTMFDTDLPTQRDRHRLIPVPKGDHNDHRRSMPHIKSAPKRSLSHQDASMTTAGEVHDRRFALARQPASDTIIYRR